MAGLDRSAEREAARRLHRLVMDVAGADLPVFPGHGPSFATEYASWVHDRRHVDAFVRYHLDLLALAGFDPAGTTVLEAGCGFGLALPLYGLLGCARVYGIEVNPRRVATIEHYLPLLEPAVADRIDARVGAVEALPYPDESMDAVLSIESAGVYADLGGFLSEATRVLRPGGAMMVAWRSNGLNPRVRRRTRDIWEAYEQGPTGHVNGHIIVTTFEDKRAAIIRSQHRQLRDDQVARLAQRTSGMTECEVLAATRAYVDEGTEPSATYQRGTLPMAPEGMLVERLLDPRRLAADIEQRGLETLVRGYWGGAAAGPLFRALNRVLGAATPLTLRTAPGFRVVARKPVS